jgi:GntR family transcriptional regulator
MDAAPAESAAMTAQTPQYQFIAESLLRQISEGAYGVGTRLPIEVRLAAEHGVARETIRRALDRLEQLGMIERRPGAGTRVVSTRPVGPYPTFATSIGDIASLAAETRLVRPESAEVIVDADTARDIGSRPLTAWFKIQGLRVRRSNPRDVVCWSEHYIRADNRREKFFGEPIALEDVAATTIEQRVRAELLRAPIADELGVPHQSAALVIIRRHRDKSGRVLGAGVHTHPAHHYEIVTTVKVDPGPIPLSGK